MSSMSSMSSVSSSSRSMKGQRLPKQQQQQHKIKRNCTHGWTSELLMKKKKGPSHINKKTARAQKANFGQESPPKYILLPLRSLLYLYISGTVNKNTMGPHFFL
ncbi:hypothetical protein MVEG_08032 [Podila verticillata NRRL 6337]|nr:hypothetical protein MVEG_08032 [Podila verticillata NRRL 6337]